MRLTRARSGPSPNRRPRGVAAADGARACADRATRARTRAHARSRDPSSAAASVARHRGRPARRRHRRGRPPARATARARRSPSAPGWPTSPIEDRGFAEPAGCRDDPPLVQAHAAEDHREPGLSVVQLALRGDLVADLRVLLRLAEPARFEQRERAGDEVDPRARHHRLVAERHPRLERTIGDLDRLRRAATDGARDRARARRRARTRDHRHGRATDR